MHTDYAKLAENHIGVWSVKTDACVIRKEHLRRAKNLIEFNQRIGGWRHYIVTRIAHRIGNGSYPLSHVHRSALVLFNTVGLSTIR